MEEANGEPFVGRSGQLLEDVLFMLGLKREDVWMTNIVMCRPTDFDNPNKNRAPSQEEIRACKDRLHEEIYHIDPLVVVALGSVAAKALGGPSINVTSYRGRWVDIKIPSRDKNRFLTYPMMVTWHPSYVMRKFGTDMEPVSRFLRDHFSKLPTSNQPEHQIVWDILLAYESALDAYLRERGEPINDSMKELARIIS
jgi:DNA polymerase